MKRALSLLLVACALVSAAAADTITPQAAIARLFTSDRVDPDWFAQSLLQQAPASQVQSVVDQLKSQLGAYQDVRPEGDHFSTVFAKASVPTYITLDSTGRITALYFKQPITTVKDLPGAVNTFRALRGKVGLVIEAGTTVTQAINADEPLAVGSAFKLAVLAALKKQVEAKRMSWAQIVTIRAGWKSLPTGVLQTWPDGSPLTLDSVAALMISQSDNTAADLALRTVGRSAVEAEAPPRDTPFLTTREAFQLKDPANAQLLARWRSGDVAARRAVLETLTSKPLPSIDIFTGRIAAPDVEWFFSARDLCSLMGKVAALPLMSINPGVADPARWARVAYKGGSETGVLNLTTQVVSRSGKTYCVSATWNDSQPVDEKQFELMYSLLLNNLE
ncbi:MAG TPA: serine hydrolase [Candidatus Eremiobacteraceae bacterium]|nr:serine hydrolase [Candidatus Eremiobacteraceae bacterium]